MNNGRPIPLLGDISLEFVQRIEHTLESGFAPTRIAGLPGELQQRTGRSSHRIRIAGLLIGAEAADRLKTLQEAAQGGEELSFAADITQALDLQKVVISGFRATEVAGRPHWFQYELLLAESPPLPPPAQISGFGGLDDFGLGDLGFDAGLLEDIAGDLQALADQVAGAVDAAMNAMEALSTLANLDGLSLGGFLEPMNAAVNTTGEIATNFQNAARSLAEAFS
ncbi:MAG TPA: hypothetical protein VNJ09_08995 [Chthonomonadales bacterium]|nr:hypothetical protein [Chthonomonadales bacterium]